MKKRTDYGILIIFCTCFLVSLLLINSGLVLENDYHLLYFEDYQNLPYEIELDESYSFIFVIENHEGGEESYEYEVLLYLDGELYDNLQEGDIELGNGSMVYITQEFTISEEFEEAQIVVSANDQEVYFYITLN